MALFIPYRCPKCFESVMLTQPQHKGGAFKGPAKGQFLNCMDEQEYDLIVPVNRRDLINVIEAVISKADVRLTASIGRNRPKADIYHFQKTDQRSGSPKVIPTPASAVRSR